MRLITQYTTRSYSTRSSAARAAKNATGKKYVVEDRELRKRFDGFITIRSEMLAIFKCGDGHIWSWSYTFDLADVMVSIPGEDGTVKHAPYPEVCHWRDASTPSVGPLVELGRQVAAYMESGEGSPNSEWVQACRCLCEAHGTSLSKVADLYRQCCHARNYEDPQALATLIVRAEPYGLVTGVLRLRFKDMARRCGVSEEDYLRLAQGELDEEKS